EITRLHKQLGFTVVYVTHDQAEALTMSSRIAVFNQGRVQQYDTPDRLYEQPANAFVASFIGENNLIPASRPDIGADGKVRVALPDGSTVLASGGDCRADDHISDCIVSVRPEKLLIADESRAFDNHVHARFIARHYVG